MRYVMRLIRLLSLMIGLGFLAFAAVGAAKERAAREALPTRIGQPQVETTYWQDVARYAANMWTDFYITYLPGLVPAPVAYQRQDPSSLEALRTRTRNINNGLSPEGSVALPKF